MEQAYPYLPLFESQALGVALFSYRDRISWGLTGDWDRLPDLADIATALEASFAELRLAAAAEGLGHAPPTEVPPSALAGRRGRGAEVLDVAVRA
jgi:diacylglycerol O-acyltransferase